MKKMKTKMLWCAAATLLWISQPSAALSRPYYSFSILAGPAASPGSADGPGYAARFSYPSGVAEDGSGNVYVADTGNNTIRKITPGGVVTTLAGLARSGGSADGTGSAARFHGPSGVAVDGAGNVYVGDTGNNTIRKITPDGVVTTLAGLAGSHGSTDGTGSAARFYNPSGVAVDGAGNVYVADAYNNTIRMITPGAVVTTLAGLAGNHGSADGTGSAARFYNPSGVAVDRAGYVYVADYGNSTIREITPFRVVRTLAGLAGSQGSDDGTNSAARFDEPSGVAVDGAGNVYVADTFNYIIRKITPGGMVTTLAGTAGFSGSADGTGTSSYFDDPSSVAVDGSGNVYVADSVNNTIRKITSGGVVTTAAGLTTSVGSADGTNSAARFNNPGDVAVDASGNVYVADTGNATIRKITPSGVVTTLAGLARSGGSADGTGNSARFNMPYGVAVDGAGNVYVADTGNDKIRKITPGGVVTTLAGGSVGSADGTGSAAQFSSDTRSVAVDGAGNVYVADTGNYTIRKITPGGVVTTLAGLAGSSGIADGTGSAARFFAPNGVAADAAGNVYVADTYTIRRVTHGGVVTTLAGLAGAVGGADGTNSAARFNNCQGVAVDGSGNVYVADTGNDTIRKIAPGGVVTTQGGFAGQPGSDDGTGGDALFNTPAGVAVDGSGNLYVADTANQTIRFGNLRPLLTLRRAAPATLVISWPSYYSAFALQQNTNPAATDNWSYVDAPYSFDGATMTMKVIVSQATGHRFYRLIQ
jgi:hypothetical protein